MNTKSFAARRWFSVALLVFCFEFNGALCYEITNTFSDQSTQFHPPSKFYWVDARKHDYFKKLQFASLQALANRTEPILFGIWREEDISWLSAIQKQLGVASEEIAYDDALKRFGATAPQVIWDANQPWTLSIATTLAGIHHAILSNSQMDGHELVFDCHNQWANKFDAYQWAMRELLPKCNQTSLAYLDETLPSTRDYIIQEKLFSLNLDPLNNQAEVRLLEDILGHFGPQTRVFGWPSPGYARLSGQNGVTVEDALVKRLSKHDMMLIPADFCGNLSFLSRTQPYVKNLAQQRHNRDVRFQKNRRYIMLMVSEGDNLQYVFGAMHSHWLEERPMVPLSWSISPQLKELAPVALDIYYREAQQRGKWDEFVAGPSGYGYTNPSAMTAAQFHEFVEATKKACYKTDMTSVLVLDKGPNSFTRVPYLVNGYAAADFGALWLVALSGTVGAVGKTSYLSEQFRMNSDNCVDLAHQIQRLNTRQPFVMVYVNGWDNVGKMTHAFASNLDESCTLVSATEMGQLIQQWVSLFANTREITATPTVNKGLSPVKAGDGEFLISNRSGANAWLTPKGNYLYFDVDERFEKGVMDVEIEYLDFGVGEIKLEYDSTDVRAPLNGAYKTCPSVVNLKNTRQWRLGRFRLNDPHFANSQNYQSDFRFRLENGEMTIREVRVRRVGP